MVTTVFNKSVPKLYAVNPPPQQCYIQNLIKIGQYFGRYSCLKVWTDSLQGKTYGGPSLYYKLTLWAFGSGELIIYNFHFCPCKSLCDQIWPWHKIGQGQPRVIIWTILVELKYTMLHTKFQGHQSIGSGEKDYLRFLPYMGMAATLVKWPYSFV